MSPAERATLHAHFRAMPKGPGKMIVARLFGLIGTLEEALKSIADTPDEVFGAGNSWPKDVARAALGRGAESEFDRACNGWHEHGARLFVVGSLRTRAAQGQPISPDDLRAWADLLEGASPALEGWAKK